MDWTPVFISLKTAAVSIFFTFFTGLFAAWKIVCMKDEKKKIILDGILTLPLVLPPTVAGFFLLCLFGVKRPVGKFFLKYLGAKIAFSWGATVIAAAVISFPLMYRAAKGAFGQVNEDYIAAGKTLGMSGPAIFWSVVCPNALPGIVSGGVLAFARGLGEFGATAMLAGNIAGKTETLPLAVYAEVAAGRMDIASRYVLIIMLIAFVSVALIDWAEMRRGRKG